jgi:hypothetical protein
MFKYVNRLVISASTIEIVTLVVSQFRHYQVNILKAQLYSFLAAYRKQDEIQTVNSVCL